MFDEIAKWTYAFGMRTLRQVLVAVVLLTVHGDAVQAQAAEQSVRLSKLLATFLADSGVRTQGLRWTTGNDLPIRWKTAAPVRNDNPAAVRAGSTLMRIGTARVSIGDSATLPIDIVLYGAPVGLTRSSFYLSNMQVDLQTGGGFFMTREMVDENLRDEGITLQPLKCSREKEGASYGNLIDAMRAPGKTASGLCWTWDNPRDGPTLGLTLLYRRAEMSEVECNSP